jgi:hypothetical protein
VIIPPLVFPGWSDEQRFNTLSFSSSILVRRNVERIGATKGLRRRRRRQTRRNSSTGDASGLRFYKLLTRVTYSRKKKRLLALNDLIGAEGRVCSKFVRKPKIY